MGLMDFFKSKPASLPGTAAPERPTPSAEEYPLAATLAIKHEGEFQTLLRAEMTETPEHVFARHTTEVNEATNDLPRIEQARFKTTYHQTRIDLSQASTASSKAKFAKEMPHIAAAMKEGALFAAAIERGDDVPSWARDVFERGRADALARVNTVSEVERKQIYIERHTQFDEWCRSVDDEERRWISRSLYDAGEGRGEDQAQKAQFDAAMAAAPPAPVKPASYLNDTSFWDHQVSTIKFLAGDLGKGNGYLLNSGKVRIPGGAKDFHMFAVATVEAASEESVKRVGGAIGWGVAGASLFGPAGFIVGGLLGGQGRDVTFVGTLKDGKRFMATAKSDVYTKFLAASFK